MNQNNEENQKSESYSEASRLKEKGLQIEEDGD